jgi:hypothetical protein
MVSQGIELHATVGISGVRNVALITNIRLAETRSPVWTLGGCGLCAVLVISERGGQVLEAEKCGSPNWLIALRQSSAGSAPYWRSVADFWHRTA